MCIRDRKKAPCKAYHRRHLFQPLFQQTRDDHSRTQTRPPTDPNDIRRHEDQRDRRDKRAAPEHLSLIHISAANPSYVDEASVPAEVVAKEKEIMLAQMAGDPKNANKPDAVKQKMIEGKIKKFFKENCLVDQEFVKDGDLSVAQYTCLLYTSGVVTCCW